MTEKEKMYRDNLYNSQFFYNLPAINFRMRHDREEKMCRDNLYNIQFFQNLYYIATFYKFQNEALQRKKRCAEINFILHSIPSQNYRLSISEG